MGAKCRRTSGRRRVNGGSWQSTRLIDVQPNRYSWTRFEFAFNPGPGDYVIETRATDRKGFRSPQPSRTTKAATISSRFRSSTCASPKRMRISINRDFPLGEEPNKGHNRWHPDIPAIATVQPGEQRRDRDARRAQRSSQAGDDRRRHRALCRERRASAHGPAAYRRRESPAICSPCTSRRSSRSRAATPSFRGPDFGFLRDVFNYKYLVHWEIEGELARSPQIPGVAIPGAPFMGVMGVAPSHELMKTIVAREAELASQRASRRIARQTRRCPRNGAVRQHARCARFRRAKTAEISTSSSSIAGTTLSSARVCRGRQLSTGDAHFAQGDGESCGTALKWPRRCTRASKC